MEYIYILLALNNAIVLEQNEMATGFSNIFPGVVSFPSINGGKKASPHAQL